ncbi:M48 family metallopeptidase [Thiomicrorhabdus sp. Milos-T2]|uniref:M48 family metallopeptidase n=1 Tax=Thiomicrorhabdus sp. Milos-T2 TaxID=90814 RepID=UPI000689B725|nr:M48 family metallopeptidase [Thiomicrorhabdus sp. Milos-T2]
MNFYSAQDNAKKKTTYLVLLYILILMVLTVLSSLVLMLLLPFFTGERIVLDWQYLLFSPQSLPTLLGVGGFVIGGALISSFVKSRHLSKGGAVIAGALGGVKLSPNSKNLNERKALNVVEEMAIASGMPVPEVYLLRNESAINAFAAGQTVQDAVIGLTQGTIDKLSRSQLQGVVGHEFSHILNGDMRLNLRIIMLLHGIEFIGLLGRIMTASGRSSRSRRSGFLVSSSSSRSSRSKGNGAIVLAGIALRILGWFGALCGNMIQAAVSRQREFLADASSVQFTRNPDAIAGALKVIGGATESSRLKNTESKEVAHMFFGQSFHTRLAFLFATHPPIALRIQRIQPNWDGQFLKPQEPLPVSEPIQKSSKPDLNLGVLPEPLALLMAAGVIVDQLSDQSKTTLVDLIEKANDPMEAMALVMAVLICEESSPNQVESEWQKMLPSIEIEGLANLVKQQVNLLRQTELINRLPLVELTMPALKTLSDKQYLQFKSLMQQLMDLDNEQTIFEQSVYQLVTRYLDVHFGLAKKHRVRYRNAKKVAIELQLIFSALVFYGHTSKAGKQHSKQASLSSTMDLAFKSAMQKLDLPNLQRIETDSTQPNLFKNATEKLLYCSEPLKQKIVEALVVCIEYDGKVNSIEKELVLAIAATMNAPIPRIKL